MIFNLLFSQPDAFFAVIFAFVVSVSVHEFAHAATATWLGDRTAQLMGRLTLNPLSHIDPMGFILVLFFGVGWGKPVPFNPFNLANRRWGPAFISVAGPLTNVALLLLSALTLRIVGPLLGPNNLLVTFLLFMIWLNLILAVFNLIPVHPLDGSKLLFGLLPSRFSHWQVTLERVGPIVLFGVILVDVLLPGVSIFGRLFTSIYGAIQGFIF